jgi:hypothetical membrane protein
MSSRRPAASTLARLAIAGILVYIALDVALVFLRPHFSVLHNAESDYGSSGRYAWVMDLNFLLRAAFSLAVARALMLVDDGRERVASIAYGGLIVWALASGALAFFPDDPVGTPTHGLGKAHLALAFIAFAGSSSGRSRGRARLARSRCCARTRPR